MRRRRHARRHLIASHGLCCCLQHTQVRRRQREREICRLCVNPATTASFLETLFSPDAWVVDVGTPQRLGYDHVAHHLFITGTKRMKTKNKVGVEKKKKTKNYNTHKADDRQAEQTAIRLVWDAQWDWATWRSSDGSSSALQKRRRRRREKDERSVNEVFALSLARKCLIVNDWRSPMLYFVGGRKKTKKCSFFATCFFCLFGVCTLAYDNGSLLYIEDIYGTWQVHERFRVFCFLMMIFFFFIFLQRSLFETKNF